MTNGSGSGEAATTLADTQTLEEAITQLLVRDAYLRFVWGHATRVGAVLAFALVVFKLFGVAHFDADIALTLATVSSAPATLLSLVVSLAPFLVAVLAFTGVLVAKDFWSAGERRGWVLIPAAALMAVSFAVTPIGLFGYLTLMLFYLAYSAANVFLIRWVWRRFSKAFPAWPRTLASAEDGDRSDNAILPFAARVLVILAPVLEDSAPRESRATRALKGVVNSVFWGLVGAMVAIVVTYDVPWLPAQKVTLSSGATTVAYVIASSSDSVTLLEDSNRSITVKRAGDVSSTVYCRKDDMARTLLGSQSTLQFLLINFGGRQPALPRC